MEGLVREYLRRMSRRWKTEWKPVRASSREGPRQLKAEGGRLLKHIRGEDLLVLVDERGDEMDTMGLTRWLGEREREGRSIVFVVGGADGVSEEVRRRANVSLRLSRFTLQHDLALLVLVEQLYRAFTILTGHPYHR